jgi:hypothetical protein
MTGFKKGDLVGFLDHRSGPARGSGEVLDPGDLDGWVMVDWGQGRDPSPVLPRYLQRICVLDRILEACDEASGPRLRSGRLSLYCGESH